MAYRATMRILRLFLLVVSLATTVAVGEAIALAQDDSIPIAVNAWPPYIEEGSQSKGLATQIVQGALDKVGRRAHLVFVPWARAEQGVKHGVYLASYPWFDTPQRRDFALFTKPFLRSRTVFFYRKDRLERVAFETIAGLSEYRIAGQLGYFYKPLFDEAHLKVDYVKTPQIAFKMLNENRVDLVPDDEVVGWSILEAMYPGELHRFATTRQFIRDDPGHMIVSKKSPKAQEFVDAFNRGLELLRASGEYDQIVKRYTSHYMLDN